MRISWKEALDRGIVKPGDVPETVRPGTPAPSHQKEPERTPKGQDTKAGRSLAQDRLFELLCNLYPDDARTGRLVSEHRGVVGRRFSFDIAWPHLKLAVEVDGWQYHGKHKADFHRDREKDGLAQMQGWRIVRIYASKILNPESVQEAVDMIRTVHDLRVMERAGVEQCSGCDQRDDSSSASAD